MEHSLTAVVEKVVRQPLDYDGRRLHEGGEEEVHERSVRTYECECGETFDSEQVALAHLDEKATRLEPEVVNEITQKLRSDRAIETGLKENGFVLRDSRNRYYVGFELADSEPDGGYLVFAIWGREKLRGKNDREKRTERTCVVTGESRDVDSLPFPYAEMEAEDFRKRERQLASELEEHLDQHGKIIDRGYTPAYRTDSVADAVEETFRWYTVA